MDVRLLTTLACAFPLMAFPQVNVQSNLVAAVSNWGVDSAVCLDTIDLACRASSRSQDQDGALVDLFCAILNLPYPSSANIKGTNEWLAVKIHTLQVLGESQPVVNDTNCWFAAACEHARLAQMDAKEWYELAGAGNFTANVGSDGVLLLNTEVQTNSPSVIHSELLSARRLKSRIAAAKDASSRYFILVSASPVLNSFLPSVRNDIVSNLVEVARFSQDEVLSAGLTNVVETSVGE